jgi:hypothetical protein
MDISKGQSVSNGNNIPFAVSVVQGVAAAEAADRREQLLELRGLRDEGLITESVFEKKQQEVLAHFNSPAQMPNGGIPVASAITVFPAGVVNGPQNPTQVCSVVILLHVATFDKMCLRTFS